MPIYEYECQACGHRLEALQRLSDDPLTDCPACGEAKLVKLVSAAAFQLKGTGWYVTDFRDKGKKKAEGRSEGKAGGSGGASGKEAGTGAKAASGGSS
ncbi:MAG: zinc ribbon domain-containing protein [Gammaproteobacteria bacterium]|nr:MAG: zinc ribbon domain-containing protein [Gammaproteobacteria bacterium]